MKVFRFDTQISHPIHAYGSRELLMSRLVSPHTAVRVDVMHIGPGGVVGGHPASENQLFAVVQGDGWVKSEEGGQHHVAAGLAVFWIAGEWHESGSDGGMTVVVIEGPELDPTGVMVPGEG